MNGINRNKADTGWLIAKGYDVNIRKFLDRDYGGSAQAHTAAKQELRAATGTLRKQETKVRSNKKSLDIVGITYYTVVDGKQIKHRFAVCDPATGSPRIVHIGNQNTYAKHWETKLTKAKSLREQLVQEHRQR